jgi:hypothetical protein
METKSMKPRLRRRAGVLAAALSLGAFAAGAEAGEPFSEQRFMDAAFDNCARVENRQSKSCECEQKLIKDRLSPEDKEMAYYYWTDKPKFAEKFEEKRRSDDKWQEAFGERFATLQALVIAACGA